MSGGAPFLPYARQTIEADDLAAVAEALTADYLTTGPRVAAFERAFAETVGARHATVSNSGTAALHLATLAARLGPGDCAIVPTLTFLATANAVRYVEAEVVFADVDAETGLLTPATLGEALERADRAGLRPRMVLPVHLNGHSCDMEGIARIAADRGLIVVEDACHALGGTQTLAGNAAPVGACGASEFACFSLHPAKTVTMGEGGVTTTNDDEAQRLMQQFRTHGMVRDATLFELREEAFDPATGAANPWCYEMPEIGWNYRATDIACALGASQLKKLERFVGRRNEIAALYDRAFRPLAPWIRPVADPRHGRRALHLYALAIDFERIGMTRAQIMNRLRTAGIGTQVHYLPVHRQPYYRRRYGLIDLPGADQYYAGQLSIPFYPALADAEALRTVEAFADLLREAKAA